MKLWTLIEKLIIIIIEYLWPKPNKNLKKNKKQ